MEKDLNKIAKELMKASNMHKEQSGRIKKLLSRKDNQAIAKMMGNVKCKDYKSSVAKFIEPTPSPTMPDKKENPTLVNKPININTGTGSGLSEEGAKNMQKRVDNYKGRKSKVQEEDAKKSEVAGSDEDGVTKIGTDKDGNPIMPNDVASDKAKGNVAKTFEVTAAPTQRKEKKKKKKIKGKTEANKTVFDHGPRLTMSVPREEGVEPMKDDDDDWSE